MGEIQGHTSSAAWQEIFFCVVTPRQQKNSEWVCAETVHYFRFRILFSFLHTNLYMKWAESGRKDGVGHATYQISGRVLTPKLCTCLRPFLCSFKSTLLLCFKIANEKKRIFLPAVEATKLHCPSTYHASNVNTGNWMELTIQIMYKSLLLALLRVHCDR